MHLELTVLVLSVQTRPQLDATNEAQVTRKRHRRVNTKGLCLQMVVAGHLRLSQ